MNEKRYIHAVGRPGRLLGARLLPGQDVVEAVIEMVKTNKIRSGTVSAIGSLREATVMYPNSMDMSKDPKEVAVFHRVEGPVEMGYCYGAFGTEENGEINMHIHALIMDKEGDMRCGNLVPGSAPVFATVEMTILEMEGLELVPTLDDVFNHKFLHPTPTEVIP